jgi:N-methylhydantoinase A/oxoprolinase/acetone carboxylase beta subunit
MKKAESQPRKAREERPQVPAAVPENALDELYGLPLEEFTGARNRLAAELRSRGEREAAAWVAGLTKPSAAAWAVNQVMRTQRQDARDLLDAGGRLRKAHESIATGGAGAARALREAAEAERVAVGRLSNAARGLVNARGRGLSETILERVTQTLHAIAADSEVRSLAAVGRLSREPRSTPAFGPPVTRVGRRQPASSRPSEAELRKARKRLERAEREARELRGKRTRAARATADAERALERARKDERAADHKVANKEDEIEQLRRRLAALEGRRSGGE